MAVGAAVGVLANGVSNAIQGQSFFKNAGMAAAMGAVGGAMAGGVANAALNVASSYLGVDINLGGGFNLSLSPALAFGSQGFSMGANVGLGFAKEGFSAGINASGGFTNMSLGPNSLTGWTGSVGGGVMWGDKDGGFGLYTNRTFGAAGQLVAGFSGSYNGFSLTYENDGYPFSAKEAGSLINKMNNNKDRWRTAAISLGYGGVDARLNLFTGEPGPKPNFEDPNYPLGVHTGNADMYRLGALSIGYRGQRVGWNSEGIRHYIQNEWAHKRLKPQPWFRHLGGSGNFYYESSSFSNPYSLWSF